MAEQLDRQVISDQGMKTANTCIQMQDAEADETFAQEWTREHTDVRLRDWNAACISHRFGVRLTEWSEIRVFEEEVGWTYEDLLSAVILHYSDQYGDAAWVLPTNAAMTQVQRPKLGTKRVLIGPGVGRNRTEGQAKRICKSGPAQGWREYNVMG